MDRREKLVRVLAESDVPLTGAELARRFGVTRQVIVKDIAVLRAQGYSIVATPQGYFQPKRLMAGEKGRVYRVMTIRHAPERTEQELLILVDSGVEVLDVSVDHPIYGEFIANLMFSSRRDVLAFSKRVQEQGVPLLLTLAGGVHRHTLAAREEEAIDEAIESLRMNGFDIIDER